MFSSKYRIHAILLMIALFIIFLPYYMDKPDEKQAMAAKAAAADFLQLVDADRFAESWQQSASLLKEKITEDQWVEQLTKTRRIAGAHKSRSQEEITYSTGAKDSPEGEYILLIYASSFENKAEVKEMVTVMHDSDQRWRVAGYFIQ